MIALETFVLTLINRVAVLLYLENEIVSKNESLHEIFQVIRKPNYTADHYVAKEWHNLHH